MRVDDLAARFDPVIAQLTELNLGDLWDHATDQEKRQLLDEILQDVTVHGAPPLNVAFSEVGLRDSELVRVGGPT